MKNILVILPFLFVYQLNAQSMLFLKNGDILEVKAKSIDDSTIVVKKLGSVFYQPKVDTFNKHLVEKITDKYGFDITGYFFNQNNSSEKQWQTERRILLLERNTKASAKYLRSARNYYYGGWCLSAIGTILHIYAVAENSRNTGTTANMFTIFGSIGQIFAYSQLAKAGNELEEEYDW